MFDQSKVLFLSGTVKQYELVNPHVWLHLAVVNDKGEGSTWVFEGGSATQMIRLGWAKDDIKIGEKAEIAVPMGKINFEIVDISFEG